MSFIPWIIQYAWQWPFELTRKDFSIDDRTSNWFTYQSWNSWSDVNGWYWRALITDWNGACYKNYANIYSWSYIRMRGYLNVAYWWAWLSAVFEDTNQWAISIISQITWSTYNGWWRWQCVHNWTVLATFSIANWVFYEVELKMTSNTAYTANLYASDWTTILATYSWTTTNVPKWVRWHLDTTIDNLQYCDWMETKIYY